MQHTFPLQNLSELLLPLHHHVCLQHLLFLSLKLHQLLQIFLPLTCLLLLSLLLFHPFFPYQLILLQQFLKFDQQLGWSHSQSLLTLEMWRLPALSQHQHLLRYFLLQAVHPAVLGLYHLPQKHSPTQGP